MFNTNNNWWKAFYDDTPFEGYLERHDPAELKETIAFLTEKLSLLADTSSRSAWGMGAQRCGSGASPGARHSLEAGTSR